ncbi:hypothetical protein AMJ49_03520 [Parcubacteria bacterium DG_74_2]|nr:MAG: hypothetical protein AMJ49_03520 [Parcubacteria bacterium DG_74_2]
MNRKIFFWQIFGIIFTVLVGSFLHFIYELSNFWKPLALIGAVNESTWEHLKIGFWPAFIFGIIEYFKYGKKYKNFFVAKVIGFYAIPVLITLLFYGYTTFMEDNLFFDILIFVVAIVSAYLLSYKTLISEKVFLKYKNLAIILIIIEVLAFTFLSYFPLKNFLFLDPVTGGYGIIK